MSRLFSEEEIYEKFRPYVSSNDLDEIMEEMTETKAVVIPDNATNGDMVKFMFPNCEVYEHKVNTNSQGEIIVGYDVFLYAYHPSKSDNGLGFGIRVFFDIMWWNAPYMEGGRRMSKTIQRPLACRNAHCGAMCYPAQAEDMFTFCGGNPYKCFNYERRDDLYRQTEILDKVKKARKEIDELDGDYLTTYEGASKIGYGKYVPIEDVLEILDKLISESE